jgi:hypothetical protein
MWAIVTIAAMRKVLGIALISLGSIGLVICGIVLLRLPLSIPGFLLQAMGSFAIFIEPGAPIWSALFLTIGVVLLAQKQKAVPSK